MYEYMGAMPRDWVPQPQPQTNMGIDSVLFIDSPEENRLVLDFPRYVKTISEMIEKSTPKFNVGIFGGWGTGKTTLMWNIEKTLNEHQIKAVRFNAWRYQNEKAHATIPLMLTIISDLARRKEIQNIWDRFVEEQKGISEPKKEPETWKQKIKRILKGLSFNVSFGIAGLAEIGIGYEPPEITHEEPEKTQARIEIERANLQKTTLQEGLDLIEGLLKHINGSGSNLKLVVFVDDLDRCTPEKAIEVFESIKIFFDIEGIVFVLGLSNEIVELAINEKYKYLGGRFSGQDYLKKIIQLPFTIPQWREEDLGNYLDELLSGYGHENYRSIFNANKELILYGVERNPRELKRFLNHFIIAYEIYGQEKGIKQDELMAIQALRLRWHWFLDAIFETDTSILKTLDWNFILNKLPEGELARYVGLKKSDLKQEEFEKLDLPIQAIISLAESSTERRILLDKDLCNFLWRAGKTILNINRENLELYRRAQVAEINLPNERKRKDDEDFGATREDLQHKLRELDGEEERITEQIKKFEMMQKMERKGEITNEEGSLKVLLDQRNKLFAARNEIHDDLRHLEGIQKRKRRPTYYK